MVTETGEIRTKDIPWQPSKIENIDAAMMDYLDNKVNLFTETRNGWEKVPVIWTSSERYYQSKRDSRVRDDSGALIFPILTLERTSVKKDPAKKGTVWANILPGDDVRGGSIPVARTINQTKTSNFENAHAKRKRGQINFPMAKNKKTVYETITVPLPVYITINYEITIRTEYQQQMNELMSPFVTMPGGINYILIKNENHSYEGFIQQDFAHNNNVSSFSSEERKFETKINVEVLGYLIGDGKNQSQPFYARRENAVEVKIPRERVVLGDEVEGEKTRRTYRSLGDEIIK